MDVGFITRRSQWPCRSIGDDRPAVSFEGLGLETWSYGYLHRRANAYANALLRLGVKRGGRAGILMYNALKYWALYMAVTRIGAIAVRLNFRLTAAELEFAITDSDSIALCFHSSLAPALNSICEKLTVRDYIALEYGDNPVPPWALAWSTLQDGEEDEPQSARPAEADPAMLMYTSGTTGRPKGGTVESRQYPLVRRDTSAAMGL